MKPSRRTLLFLLMAAAVLLPTLACAMLTAGAVSCTAWWALPVESVLLVLVYRSLFRPLRIIESGMDLLREQDFSSRLRKVSQPEADRLVEIFNDMMDRLKAQNLRMQEQNAFLKQLIDAAPMAVMILNDADLITSANPAARRMLGIDAVPCSLGSLESPLARSVAATGRDSVRTVRLGGRKIYRCSRLHFMDRGWPHPFVLIESMSEEVRQAERTALTRVIRTMAHEVNNSMAGILSTLDTLGSILHDDPSTAPLLPPLQACMTRSEEMTAFIGRFADVVKVPEPTLCLTDYQELVESSQLILQSLCHRCGARLVTDVEASSPLRLDPTLMQQVLVNVVKNAAESAGPGGTVSITAHHHTLTVTDNGPGLAPGADERLFSSLYTTKPQGQGLGLMLVAEILHKHHADFGLRTDSAAPHLTTFTITLP